MLLWPVDLPLADLVSCRLTPQQQPAIYVMLPKTACVVDQAIYRRFLFARDPHPMLLWLNALAGPDGQVQWLRCFFDLKHPGDRQVLTQLIAEAEYLLLLFAREDATLERSFRLKLEFRQRDLLAAWLRLGQQLHAGSPAIARRHLSNELDRLKPHLMKELVSPTG